MGKMKNYVEATADTCLSLCYIWNSYQKCIFPTRIFVRHVDWWQTCDTLLGDFENWLTSLCSGFIQNWHTSLSCSGFIQNWLTSSFKMDDFEWPNQVSQNEVLPFFLILFFLLSLMLTINHHFIFRLHSSFTTYSEQCQWINRVVAN